VSSHERNIRLEISVIVAADEGSFHAYAPALKGLHVDGETEKEALDNAIEAIKVYLNSLEMHGDPLPVGPDLKVREEEATHYIPPGAFLRHVTMQWPSLETSGIS
jgi:predicted RNase H-like HicB family nuclease